MSNQPKSSSSFNGLDIEGKRILDDISKTHYILATLSKSSDKKTHQIITQRISQFKNLREERRDIGIYINPPIYAISALELSVASASESLPYPAGSLAWNCNNFASNAIYPKTEIWDALTKDCEFLSIASDAKKLATSSLWYDEIPDWYQNELSNFAQSIGRLGFAPSIYMKWLQRRVVGIPADVTLEIRRASISNNDWMQGEAHITNVIVELEEERAKELLLEQSQNSELPPVPDSGPGAELQLTPSGFETVSTPNKMDEAVLGTQKILHNLLLRRANRLDSEIARICNTHRSLRDEYEDYITFIRVPFDEIDVTSIWSVGAALNDMVMRLERQFKRAQTSIQPTDLDELPDEAILSQLSSLVRDHSGFIMGYDEALALNAKAAKLHRLEISSQVLSEQAEAVLNPMLQTTGLLAEKATKLVVALDRALDGVEERTIALVTSSIMAATKYVVSFGRGIMTLLIPFTLVAGSLIDVAMKLSGDPNWETLRAAMHYLYDNRQAISALAAHDTVFIRWFTHLVSVIELAVIEDIKNKEK